MRRNAEFKNLNSVTSNYGVIAHLKFLPVLGISKIIQGLIMAATENAECKNHYPNTSTFGVYNDN